MGSLLGAGGMPELRVSRSAECRSAATEPADRCGIDPWVWDRSGYNIVRKRPAAIQRDGKGILETGLLPCNSLLCFAERLLCRGFGFGGGSWCQSIRSIAISLMFFTVASGCSFAHWHSSFSYIINSWIEVRDPGGLITTPYGPPVAVALDHRSLLWRTACLC